MPPKLTAAEIEANDAARLNELGYKQVLHIQCSESNTILICVLSRLGVKARIIGKQRLGRLQTDRY